MTSKKRREMMGVYIVVRSEIDDAGLSKMVLSAHDESSNRCGKGN
jgi:hypothetical protein